MTLLMGYHIDLECNTGVILLRAFVDDNTRAERVYYHPQIPSICPGTNICFMATNRWYTDGSSVSLRVEDLQVANNMWLQPFTVCGQVPHSKIEETHV